ncbi:TRM11 family SAM-dependent methyltransferase [Cohnella silvisoli]|uniref:RsmD family RNA methyltransferase n=1 Tax=Cohnella silvisoli TaxID=2873699 RepID=A0ABV1KSM5_9BACL|nr:RsmD family RNA methyltransferase [Cohnella silvisoli]MCD9021759.1 RsmD family RNA methyltransferase [Cohnella silvisoli]
MDRKLSTYIYVVAANEEERSLCMLEMRSLFGIEPTFNLLESPIRIDPSRSPFIKTRIEVLFDGSGVEEIGELVQKIQLDGATFKVVAIDYDNPYDDTKIEYEEKRAVEREIGLHIKGKAEMRMPDRVFGVVRMGGRWRFGECAMGEAIWLKHNDKPRKYSTALSTRVARAIVNIAVPQTAGVTVIDPCCGIGTVLVEALSMGIDIVGREINPLAAIGARENVAFFGFEAEVVLGDMREISERYDVAIIDMPYNLCSVISPEEKLEMLSSAWRFASRAIIVTIESIDSIIEQSGFEIKDRCTVNKGKFTRHVIVCERL